MEEAVIGTKNRGKSSGGKKVYFSGGSTEFLMRGGKERQRHHRVTINIQQIPGRAPNAASPADENALGQIWDTHELPIVFEISSFRRSRRDIRCQSLQDPIQEKGGMSSRNQGNEI